MFMAEIELESGICQLTVLVTANFSFDLKEWPMINLFAVTTVLSRDQKKI